MHEIMGLVAYLVNSRLRPNLGIVELAAVRHETGQLLCMMSVAADAFRVSLGLYKGGTPYVRHIRVSTFISRPEVQSAGPAFLHTCVGRLGDKLQ